MGQAGEGRAAKSRLRLYGYAVMPLITSSYATKVPKTAKSPFPFLVGNRRRGLDELCQS